MVKSFVLAIACLCGLFIPTHAQDRDLPGYIVRVSGDTVRGLLKEQGTDESAKQISFKSSAADNDYQQYSFDAVKSFGYDGGNLFRAITFPDTRKEETVTRTYYGKLLVTGEFDLYTFTEDGILYFLVRKDTSFYMVYDDDLRSVPYVKGNFRNELNFFAQSCEAAEREIDRAYYSVPDMISFFQKLDECVNPNKAVASYFHKAKADVKLFVFGGGLPLGPQSQLVGEVRVQLVWAQLDPKVSFNLGLHYAVVNTKVKDPYYTVATLYDYKNYQIKSLPLTVQYSFTRGVVQPFILAGLSIATVDEQTNNPNLVDPTTTLVGHYGLSYLVGAGIEARVTHVLWVRAEWRYEYLVQYPAIGVALRVP
ncbi:MAG TPA: outer membrane beta-barrel protein [Puia sp.]|nr:outer membrane beta-barrel protein [Puia sp.]